MWEVLVDALEEGQTVEIFMARTYFLFFSVFLFYLSS